MKILTFDCYNTLLDTSSTNTVLTHIAQKHGLDTQVSEFCETFSHIEHELMNSFAVELAARSAVHPRSVIILHRSFRKRSQIS